MNVCGRKRTPRPRAAFHVSSKSPSVMERSTDPAFASSREGAPVPSDNRATDVVAPCPPGTSAANLPAMTRFDDPLHDREIGARDSTLDTTRIDDVRIGAVRPLITPALLQERVPVRE